MNLDYQRLKRHYLANIIAQTACLFINCLLFYLTRNYALIWTAVSSICFIGIITSQPDKKIIDRNLVNHLLVVLIYYAFSHICLEFNFAYFVLVFIFTYVFFILKDSGYDKSLTTWTYVQCLAFATTLVNMAFSVKIYATLLGWLEAQLLLFLSFKLFPTINTYVAEKWIYNLNHIKLNEWINTSYEKVQLAIRGSLTAGVLYLVCVLVVLGDIKPNWSVIAAVACLFKNDDAGSRRTIISFTVGTLVGFVLSWLIIKFHVNHHEIMLILLWVSLLVTIICIFEYKITLSIKPQVIGVIAVTITLTTLYLVLDLNGKFYLELRAINNFMGILAAFLAYVIWVLYKKYSNKN